MKIIKQALAILLIGLLFQSCATIMSGTQDTIYLSSYPVGATIKINGENQGKTPGIVKVKKRVFEKTMVSLSKEGYSSKEFPLKRKFNFWTIPCIQPFGTAIDALTGAMLKYSPRIYYYDLSDKNDKNSRKFDPVNFSYIVPNGGDTIYCYPEVTEMLKNIVYQDIKNASENKIDKDNVLSYKTKGLAKGVRIGKKKMEEKVVERRPVSLKEPERTELLKLEMRSGEYSLLSTEVTTGGGYDVGGTGLTGGGSATYYYFYKGEKLVEEKFTRKKNREKSINISVRQKELRIPENLRNIKS